VTEEIEEQTSLRLQKLDALRNQGADPFLIERYERSHTTAALTDPNAPHWALPDEERAALVVTVAGRISAHRTKGKVSFVDIRDESGRIQLYVKRDDLGEVAFDSFNDLDLSDIIGVSGYPFITRTGERSIHVKSYLLLAKALRSVPFGKQDEDGVIHGAIADKEDRYRRRYLDLLSNPDARDILTRRCKVVSAMRRFRDSPTSEGIRSKQFFPTISCTALPKRRAAVALAARILPSMSISQMLSVTPLKTADSRCSLSRKFSFSARRARSARFTNRALNQTIARKQIA